MTKPFKIGLPLTVANSMVDHVRVVPRDNREKSLEQLREMFARIQAFPVEGPRGDGLDPVPYVEGESVEPPEAKAMEAAGRVDEAEGRVLEFDNADQLIQWIRERL